MNILDVEVRVSSIESGSLLSDFVIKYVVSAETKEKLDEAIKSFMKEDSKKVKLVIAAGVSGFLTWAYMASKSPSAPTTHIEANNNTIITIGKEIDLSPEQVIDVIEKFTDKKKIVKSAIKVIKPAKADNSEIELSEIENLTVSKEFVKHSPDEYKVEQPSEKHKMYTNTSIVIYASDRDKWKSWGGIIPTIADKRIPFELMDSVNPVKVHGRTNVKADFTLILKLNKKTNQYIPAKAIIKAVN